MPDNHDVFVRVGLTADQFIWLRDEAEELSLSHSAFIRHLVMKARRDKSLSELSNIDRRLNITGMNTD